jgi:para-nitrobenzyl esterase
MRRSRRTASIRRKRALAAAYTALAAIGCSEPRPEASPDGAREAEDVGRPGSRDAARIEPWISDGGAEGGIPSEPDPPDLPPQSGLQITLPSGAVSGSQAGDVRTFLGIPFGTIPQRFAPSQRVAPWLGTREATRYAPACPQADNGLSTRGEESEDCLQLDVYTPAELGAKLPVMVFIHGGAFVAGASSQYDATRLARTPLVIVSINYRLGALGFFSHPALDARRPDVPSGSDGIRDQQLALRWVRENIGAFNGDRDRVTVFGESAGAISACIHWVAPGSRGLAQRFILQSGTCTWDGPGVHRKQEADALGMRMAEALCPGQPDPLACLRQKSAGELAKWGPDMGLWGPPWQPTIEGEHGVLPDDPERLAARADALAPFIVGTNRDEWGFFQAVAGSVAPATVAELSAAIASAFGDHARDVEAQYTAVNDAEANAVWMRLVTDMSFRCPTRTLARLAANRGADVWLYSFEQGLAYHAHELDYVFGFDWISSATSGAPPSQTLAGAIQRYWTRFATAGDPNGTSDPNWPRFDAETDTHLVLVDPPRTGVALASAACDFWRSYWRDGGTVDLR